MNCICMVIYPSLNRKLPPENNKKSCNYRQTLRRECTTTKTRYYKKNNALGLARCNEQFHRGFSIRSVGICTNQIQCYPMRAVTLLLNESKLKRKREASKKYGKEATASLPYYQKPFLADLARFNP